MSNEAPAQEQADFRAEETGPEQAAERLAEMTVEPTEGMEEATAEPEKASEEADDPTDAPPTGPRLDEVSSHDEGSAPLDLPPDRDPGPDQTAVFIVRPLVCQCYSSVSRLAAGIARSFPIEAVEAPILGQAVLRDLAWLCEYLRETADQFTDLEPAREALLDFLYESAPEKAPEWLQVRVPDEPLRWAFRVRTSRDLGDMMTRLVRSAVAAHELLHLDRTDPYTFACAVLTTMGEVELGMCDVPAWKPQLRKVYELAEQALDFEVPQ